MSKHILYTFILGLILSSCSTPKPIVKVKTITQLKVDTVYIKEKTKKRITAANTPHYKMHHYPASGQDFRQKFLIMHYTALDYEKSKQVLTEQEVSAHYLIGDQNNDKIEILVGEDERAWHAGVSYWNGRTNINDSSIGIEIVNNGYYTENSEKEFIPFLPYQIKKVGELAKDIVERYQIDPTYVLGHSDIAPQRKYDPGPKFPWKQLYEEYQVGAWYDDYSKNYYLTQFPFAEKDSYSFIYSVQKDLARYGYEIEPTGEWDEKSKRVLAAFQMHFRPENYKGELDAETWAILKALISKYKS